MLVHHVRLVLLVAIFAALYVAMDILYPRPLNAIAMLFKIEVLFIYALIVSGFLAGFLQPFIIWGMVRFGKST